MQSSKAKIANKINGLQDSITQDHHFANTEKVLSGWIVIPVVDRLIIHVRNSASDVLKKIYIIRCKRGVFKLEPDVAENLRYQIFLRFYNETLSPRKRFCSHGMVHQTFPPWPLQF